MEAPAPPAMDTGQYMAGKRKGYPETDYAKKTAARLVKKWGLTIKSFHLASCAPVLGLGAVAINNLIVNGKLRY